MGQACVVRIIPELFSGDGNGIRGDFVRHVYMMDVDDGRACCHASVSADLVYAGFVADCSSLLEFRKAGEGILPAGGCGNF